MWVLSSRGKKKGYLFHLFLSLSRRSSGLFLPQSHHQTPHHTLSTPIKIMGITLIQRPLATPDNKALHIHHLGLQMLMRPIALFEGSKHHIFSLAPVLTV
jgi:hypothetical protein